MDMNSQALQIQQITIFLQCTSFFSLLEVSVYFLPAVGSLETNQGYSPSLWGEKTKRTKKTNKKQMHDVQPGVFLNARIHPLPDAKHIPISPPIVRRALPWQCIPGQGLAVVHADPGRWPLTFRPGPGSEGQRWPEGNKSTSMIGTPTCSPQRLPPSRFCASHLHPFQGEDHQGWMRGEGSIALFCIAPYQVTVLLIAARGSILYNLHSMLRHVPLSSRSGFVVLIIKCNLWPD